mgnify:CR=1 FL=1
MPHPNGALSAALGWDSTYLSNLGFWKCAQKLELMIWDRSYPTRCHRSVETGCAWWRGLCVQHGRMPTPPPGQFPLLVPVIITEVMLISSAVSGSQGVIGFVGVDLVT